MLRAGAGFPEEMLCRAQWRLLPGDGNLLVPLGPGPGKQLSTEEPKCNVPPRGGLPGCSSLSFGCLGISCLFWAGRPSWHFIWFANWVPKWIGRVPSSDLLSLAVVLPLPSFISASGCSLTLAVVVTSSPSPVTLAFPQTCIFLSWSAFPLGQLLSPMYFVNHFPPCVLAWELLGCRRWDEAFLAFDPAGSPVWPVAARNTSCWVCQVWQDPRACMQTTSSLAVRGTFQSVCF